MSSEIHTATGYVVLVDDDVVLPGRVSIASHGYAQLSGAKKGVTVLLHRWLMGLETGDPREVDHLNFNRLDNRRENLRIVTKRENRQRTRNPGTKAYLTPSGRWAAKLWKDGKSHHLGTFDTREEALKARL